MARSARYRSEDRVFFSSVNVLMMDIIKIALCSTILTFSERSFSRFARRKLQIVTRKLFSFLRLCVCEILGDLGDTLRIIVPAFIYMVQVRVCSCIFVCDEQNVAAPADLMRHF